MNIAVFRSILIAFDGSENSFKACEMSVILAKSYSSELSIVQSIPPLSIYSSPLADVYYANLEDKAAKSIKTALSLIAKEGVKGTRSEILRARSSIVESIIEYASEKKSDLIVAGTRGLGGFRRMLLGSVSSGLASRASCPVLVVRVRHAAKKIQINRILVATDGSNNATKAVRIAASLAKTLASELTILNVIYFSPLVYSGADMPLDQLEKDARREAEKLTSEAALITRKDYEVKAKLKILNNMQSPVAAITNYADKNGIDLIVIGTRGLGGFRKLLLGSVANGVLHYASCSVLVAR